MRTGVLTEGRWQFNMGHTDEKRERVMLHAKFAKCLVKRDPIDTARAGLCLEWGMGGLGPKSLCTKNGAIRFSLL